MLWLAIVLVAAIIAIAWLVTLLVGLPVLLAVVITAVAALGLVAFIVFRRLRAARRAALLERELLRQAEHQAEPTRSARSAEILALEQEMRAAVESLKRLPAHRGRAGLYASPWYVIAGPPGSGKTTALERSGLAFSRDAKGGANVRTAGGTRNCEWWFSRDAVLIDTSGRYATEDDDREEWQAFLDTLRRLRPDRPIDGLVLSMSLGEVAGANDMQVEATAKKLRERIDEAMARLEMVVPVYVLFTKADLIDGFVEFFGDYTNAQRAQPWGATFALQDRKVNDADKAFESEFEALVRVLHSRMLERLASEPLPAIGAKVLQFPVELESLKAPLTRFMSELCRPNPHAEAPILRGFYFCSGAQTGRPVGRMLADLVRGFDLRLAPTVPAAAGEPHGYFLTHVFEKILFPDRAIAVRSRSWVRRTARKQVVIAFGAVFLTLALSLPAMVSYARSRSLVTSTLRDVAEAKRLEAESPAGAIGALDVLERRLELLEEAESKFRIPGWWGVRSAPELLPVVQSLYLARLRRVMEGPVREQLTGEVRGVENRAQVDAANFRDAYQLLKLYLMLGNPKEKLQAEWAAPRLAAAFRRASNDAGDRQKIASHARNYLAQLGKDPEWAWKLDVTAVTRAQGRLNELPLDDLGYGWVIAKAEDVPPIRAGNVFLAASAQYFTARGNAEVPGLYTALAWKKIRAALAAPDEALEIEPWVLGRQEATDEGDEKVVDRLKKLYFQRYVRAWSDFLTALEVSAPPDLPSAIAELRTLSEADGPFTRLFKVLRDNVTLEVQDKSLKDQLLAKGKELAQAKGDRGKDAGAPSAREVSPVEEHFKPLLRFAFGDADKAQGEAVPAGLSQYLSQLSSLEVSLTEMSANKDAPTSDFSGELSRTAASVQRLLGGLPTTTRVMLEPLLMNPIRGSRAGVSAASQAALGERWKTEVWDIWNTTLVLRFPFAKVSSDASVLEFAEFFRPQSGVLWSFFDRELKDRLVPSGNGFVPKDSADPVPFRPDFLQCLAIAQEITKAVFGNSSEPNVPFGVNVLPAGSSDSEIRLEIDGQSIVYRNEPQRWQPARWPGRGGASGASLKVKGAGFTEQVPYDGEFGFFRFLAAGGLKPAGPDKPGIVVGTWTLKRPGEQPILIEFKPSKSIHPFTPNFFQRMKCPAAMLR